MNMQTVVSSNIHSIGYENNILYIRFHSGGLYQYLNVPEQIYKALLSAPSHGKFFHSFIKGHYLYHRIG